MRIPDLRKKIIINCCALAVLLACLGGIVYFYFDEQGSVGGKILKIKGETAKINNQTTELKSRVIELKKYRETWMTLTEAQKNTAGIKMDDVNAKLEKIADKYSIKSPTIKVTLPEALKDSVFKTTTVNVLFTTVNLSFTAVSDVKALLFIDEFIDSLQGYQVITAFDIRKNKDYSPQDLVDISTGKSVGAISGKVDFFWYAYKDKGFDSKPVPSSETTKEATDATKPAL